MERPGREARDGLYALQTDGRPSASHPAAAQLEVPDNFDAASSS
jgi:hypothetical protein